MPIVLQILASEELELGARQAGNVSIYMISIKHELIIKFSFTILYIAAIYFKNRLNKAWDGERESAVPINNEDRNMVKQTILQALVTAPNQVQ